MKVIVAGTRSFNDYKLLEKVLNEFHAEHNITQIVSGAAPGADSLGERWAKNNSISIKQFQADWNRLGKSAGPKRNSEMAAYGSFLIVFWNGTSPGTADMVKKMRVRNKPIQIINYNNLDNSF